MDEKKYRNLSSDKYFHYSLLSKVSRKGGIALIEGDSGTRSTSFGSLVHVMCLQEEEFDKRYRVSKHTYDLPEHYRILFDELVKSVEVGEIHKEDVINTSDDYRSLCLLLIKSNQLWKHIKDTKKLIDKVIDDEFVMYLYDKVKGDDRELISTENYFRAKLCKKALQEHESTKKLFNPTKDASKYQIIDEYGIVFKWEDENFKILLDKIFVDHENKEVYYIDLKTGSKNHRNFLDSFFYYRYDIQATIARKALEKYVKKELNNKYRILNPRIVYVNAEDQDYTLPVIFDIPNQLLKKSYYGFSYNNVTYKGIKQLVNDINHYRKTDQYYIDKITSENNNVIYIEAEYVLSTGLGREIFEYPDSGEDVNFEETVVSANDTRRSRRGSTDTLYEQAIDATRRRLEGNDPEVARPPSGSITIQTFTRAGDEERPLDGI